ncbi:MurR/RpiR family transcriptional regulator [soil metagenome]
MGFYEELERCTRTLTESEKRVGSMLLADPRGAPFLTAAEVARRAEVHESTVIRFAQRLGYTGYMAMREALRADSIHAIDHTISMREEGESFSLAMVVASQVEILQRLPSKVSQERIDACAEAILAGQRVHILGRGLVLPLVEFMRNKLVRVGIPSITITDREAEMVTGLAAVEPADTIIVFAFADAYQPITKQLKMLGDAGTRVILLTDEDSLMVEHLPAHVVAIPRDRARHGVLVAMTALCYAINYALVHAAADQVHDARVKIERLEALKNDR